MRVRTHKKVLKMRVHENIIIEGLSETDISDRSPRHALSETDMPDRRPTITCLIGD